MKGPVEESNHISANRVERDVDFSEYMWMGEEMEEFDKKCIQEFYEQDFIESCFQELFEEEEQFAEELETYLKNLTADQVDQLIHQLDSASLSEAEKPAPAPSSDVRHCDSRLNPEAPVFVPIFDEEEGPSDQ